MLTLYCMSHANIFEIEPEISAKGGREIFLYFTYPIDINGTLHTLPLNLKAIKKDNSFWSQQNSKLTLWRGFFK